jgi:hypothetical protein
MKRFLLALPLAIGIVFPAHSEDTPETRAKRGIILIKAPHAASEIQLNNYIRPSRHVDIIFYKAVLADQKLAETFAHAARYFSARFKARTPNINALKNKDILAELILNNNHIDPSGLHGSDAEILRGLREPSLRHGFMFIEHTYIPWTMEGMNQKTLTFMGLYGRGTEGIPPEFYSITPIELPRHKEVMRWTGATMAVLLRRNPHEILLAFLNPLARHDPLLTKTTGGPWIVYRDEVAVAMDLDHDSAYSTDSLNSFVQNKRGGLIATASDAIIDLGNDAHVRPSSFVFRNYEVFTKDSVEDPKAIQTKLKTTTIARPDTKSLPMK